MLPEVFEAIANDGPRVVVLAALAMLLTAALAFRVFDQTGALPRFEDGDNARVIQSLGIPGLD